MALGFTFSSGSKYFLALFINTAAHTPISILLLNYEESDVVELLQYLFSRAVEELVIIWNIYSIVPSLIFTVINGRMYFRSKSALFLLKSLPL